MLRILEKIDEPWFETGSGSGAETNWEVGSGSENSFRIHNAALKGCIQNESSRISASLEVRSAFSRIWMYVELLCWGGTVRGLSVRGLATYFPHRGLDETGESHQGIHTTKARPVPKCVKGQSHELDEFYLAKYFCRKTIGENSVRYR